MRRPVPRALSAAATIALAVFLTPVFVCLAATPQAPAPAWTGPVGVPGGHGGVPGGHGGVRPRVGA